ncbi:mobilization protein [Marinagarivorans algicola]|uniref:mobilization protein n=1 Tax=Marinagarivorans algicola TaxID=1513270 RepID=UPI0006B887AE|nr:mobilization protein [Marinagarivorans algicola]
MGRIHFIGGEKGGVGKSLTSRLLAQYIIDSKKTFIGFDTDRSHNTFSRFYSDFTRPIFVDDYDSLDNIITTAEQNPSANIIVDLAAQTARHLHKWVEDSDVFGIFDSLGFDVFMWHVMDDGADSARLLHTLLNTLTQSSLQLVVVKNLGRGEHFECFEESAICENAIKLGAHIIELPALHARLTQKVDFNNSSFWAAANNINIMTLTERHRVKVWLKTIYQALDSVLNHNTDIASSTVFTTE